MNTRVWLIGTAVTGIMLQIYYRGRLPERVASHFGAGGHPDEWMSRDANMALGIGLIVFLSLMFALLPPLMKRMPNQFVNLPKKEYWLSPENKETTTSRLTDWIRLLGVATNTFILYLFHLVYQANRSTPVHMNEGMIWSAVGIFFTFTIVWSVLLYIRFNRIPQEPWKQPPVDKNKAWS